MSGVITLPTATSTSAVAATLTPLQCPHGTAVRAVEQTAGRGQRGNHWEAEPGRNLTLSIVLRDLPIPPARQFELSMLVSLATVEFLDRYFPAERIKIKWPNDIYVDDLKICGILIENTLASSDGIARSIVGVGININQRTFVSDAPNPVSLAMLTGREYDLDALAEAYTAAVVTRIDTYTDSDLPAILSLYHDRLWRNDGQPHEWISTIPPAGKFKAAINAVLPDGTLLLQPSGSTTPRSFLFKEVAAVL